MQGIVISDADNRDLLKQAPNTLIAKSADNKSRTSVVVQQEHVTDPNKSLQGR